MMLEAYRDPFKTLAHACSYDGLSSRLVEEAGFPMIFLAGYPCASFLCGERASENRISYRQP